jgi:alpha-L-fucosidase
MVINGEPADLANMKPLSCLLPCVRLLAAPFAIAHTSAPVSPAASTESVDRITPTLGVISVAEIDHEWQQSVSKCNGARNRLLAIEKKQDNNGPYRTDWAALVKYQQPQWYNDAKFRIFIDWVCKPNRRRSTSDIR